MNAICIIINLEYPVKCEKLQVINFLISPHSICIIMHIQIKTNGMTFKSGLNTVIIFNANNHYWMQAYPSYHQVKGRNTMHIKYVIFVTIVIYQSAKVHHLCLWYGEWRFWNFIMDSTKPSCFSVACMVLVSTNQSNETTVTSWW